MARDKGIERRLQDWAQWIKVGDGSGYPATCVLHEHWSPPAAGQTPTMKVGSPSAVRQTHRAVGMLSVRLSNTLVLHYVTNLSVADQAARLGCEPQTIEQRIWKAHRLLLGMLALEN